MQRNAPMQSSLNVTYLIPIKFRTSGGRGGGGGEGGLKLAKNSSIKGRGES